MWIKKRGFTITIINGNTKLIKKRNWYSNKNAITILFILIVLK